jgi:hypothetical protein
MNTTTSLTHTLQQSPQHRRPARLVWSKQRWKCPDRDCTIRTWCEIDERIAPARAAITDRAGRWQRSRHGRPRLFTLAEASYLTLRLVAVLRRRVSGSRNGPRCGGIESVGQRWICRCRIATCSTRCSPTRPGRWPISRREARCHLCRRGAPPGSERQVRSSRS